MPEVLITASAVGHSYADRQIIEDIDLTIHEGDRTALVGPNGGGKSTLLRLLAEIERPSSGEVGRVPGTRVTYLPQVTTARAPQRTVAEELTERTGVAASLRKLNDETQRLGSGDLSRIEAQTEAVEAWTNLGGPDIEARIGQSLESVGIPRGWKERTLASLSGGQLARINLATLALSRLDVVLLDEPGNHLDAEGLEILAELLSNSTAAVILASHDRALLTTFADQVLELERGRLRHYRGGWNSYLTEKGADRNRARTEWERSTAERRRLVELERRIRIQGEVGERKARRSGETDKFIRHDAIESSQKNTAASGISKRISDVEIPEKPWEEDLSKLLLNADQKVHSSRVVVAEALVARRGEWQSPPFDLSLSPGERLLLTGANGSGKSTLISMLAGRLAPTSGRLHVPSSLRIVELAQQASLFARGEGSLADRFETLSGLNETEARNSLAGMRLSSGQVERSPESLSPGELTRAELALLAQTGAACLLLDEPSNHLDIDGLEALEKALEGWQGALVVASHDRAFRQAVRFDRTLDLAGP